MFMRDQLKHLCHWITEREAIRVAKASGKPAPWTTDEVLRHNRFCNVRRMDDKVSVWIMDNWYTPHSKAETGYARRLMVAATLARHINWPDTLAYIGYPTKWSPQWYKNKLHQWKAMGHKVFTGAYIINGGGGKGADKIDEVCNRVQNVYGMHLNAERVASMQAMHGAISEVHGIGSFMAGQIMADLRHTPVGAHWQDALTWAPRGPGSTRGLNRLLGCKPYNTPFHDASFVEYLRTLREALILLDDDVEHVFKSRKCELMDLQNCLCEFDKYMRVKLGEGRARNRYAG